MKKDTKKPIAAIDDSELTAVTGGTGETIPEPKYAIGMKLRMFSPFHNFFEEVFVDAVIVDFANFYHSWRGHQYIGECINLHTGNLQRFNIFEDDIEAMLIMVEQ